MALSTVSISTTSKTIVAMESELEALQKQLKEELVRRIATLQASHSSAIKDQIKQQKNGRQLLERRDLWVSKHQSKPTTATQKRQQAAVQALAAHHAQLASANQLLSQIEQEIEATKLRLEREEHKRIIVKELTPETDTTAPVGEEPEQQQTKTIDVEKTVMQSEAVKPVRRGRPRKKDAKPTIADNGNRLNVIVDSAKEAVLQSVEAAVPVQKVVLQPTMKKVEEAKVEVAKPAPRVISVPMGAGNHQAKVKAKAVKSIFDPVAD